MTRTLTALIATLAVTATLAAATAPAQASSRGATNTGSGLAGPSAGSRGITDVSGMDLGSGR